MPDTEVIIVIIVLLFIFGCGCYSVMNGRSEGFCSSCTGPTAHYYKYGDPFYKYMYDQRRKYQRYPKDMKWMNF